MQAQPGPHPITPIPATLQIPHQTLVTLSAEEMQAEAVVAAVGETAVATQTAAEIQEAETPEAAVTAVVEMAAVVEIDAL